MKKILLTVVLGIMSLSIFSGCGKNGNNVSIEKRDMYGYAVLPSQFEIGKTSRDKIVKYEGEPYDYEIKSGKYREDYYKIVFDDVTIWYEYAYKYMSNDKPNVYNSYYAEYLFDDELNWRELYNKLKEKIASRYGEPDEDINTASQIWNGEDYSYTIDCYATWDANGTLVKIIYRDKKICIEFYKSK